MVKVALNNDIAKLLDTQRTRRIVAARKIFALLATGGIIIAFLSGCATTEERHFAGSFSPQSAPPRLDPPPRTVPVAAPAEPAPSKPVPKPAAQPMPVPATPPTAAKPAEPRPAAVVTPVRGAEKLVSPAVSTTTVRPNQPATFPAKSAENSRAATPQHTGDVTKADQEPQALIVKGPPRTAYAASGHPRALLGMALLVFIGAAVAVACVFIKKRNLVQEKRAARREEIALPKDFGVKESTITMSETRPEAVITD